jgi:hypothetical protein
MSSAPCGADEASTSLRTAAGRRQRDLLRDEAAYRESEQIGLTDAHRVEEGNGVPRHPRDRCGRPPGGGADSGIVERDDTPGRRQSVDQRWVPVVEVPSEVLKQNHWRGAFDQSRDTRTQCRSRR